MKILVINTVRFKLNGIAAVIMNYYKAMDKTNLEMEFLTIDEPIEEYKNEFARYSIKCHVVKKSNILKYVSGIWKVVKEGEYDIVHVHGNSANMAIELLPCLLAGVKVRIAHSHNTTTLHPFAHNLLHPFFSMLCTERFACGQDAGKWLYRKKNFVEIKNGINLCKYSFDGDIREKLRKKLGVENCKVIGHVGNFVEQKNHSYLIDIFYELLKKDSSVVLLLISDGILLPQIKEKVKSLNIEKNVIFLGKTTEVHKYMQVMDIFVLPSLYEGLPVVLIEAQAAGLQCVVSDVIDRKVNVSNSIDFIPLTNKEKWVENILDKDINVIKRSECSIRWQNELVESGYDIAENAKIMKRLYQKALD